MCFKVFADAVAGGGACCAAKRTLGAVWLNRPSLLTVTHLPAHRMLLPVIPITVNFSQSLQTLL